MEQYVMPPQSPSETSASPWFDLNLTRFPPAKAKAKATAIAPVSKAMPPAPASGPATGKRACDSDQLRGDGTVRVKKSELKKVLMACRQASVITNQCESTSRNAARVFGAQADTMQNACGAIEAILLPTEPAI